MRGPLAAPLPAWARIGPRRLAHVERVAALVQVWADRMHAPAGEQARWLRAAWLHDALRDAPEDELIRWAPGYDGPPDLRHGPAAAARAAHEGESDRGVLDAVRYHSVGWPDWDRAGRVLYCADFLEPGRTFDPEGRAALADAFPADPGGVLQEVARRRVGHAVASGWTIPEPTWRFWNRLAAGARWP
jgi:HD superfamily phosphohydrolase YqeK